MYTHRRTGKRHATMGLMSSLWNGKTSCLGIVEDVSQDGLKISQVPLYFNDSRRKCFSIVHGPGGDFTVLLQPRWKKSTNRGMYKIIGFKVDKPTTAWKKFVTERKKPTDIYRTEVENREAVA